MALDPQQLPPRPAISWRSVLLGLAGVVLICGLTPYNDYALNNTFLVGNNLPLGAVLLAFVLLVGVNGPLSRWAPRHAISSGEAAVAFSMVLVSCALPSSGLMRYFPPSLVSPFWHARSYGPYLELLEQVNLPRWLFPGFSGAGPAQWMGDEIVGGYLGRWTEEGTPVPYLAWLRPALLWGIFIFALYGALMCMVAIVHQQWVINERLPFPLAQIQLALVEQPQAGRFLNSTLSRRPFWIAFGGVFLLHLWNGSAKYWPEYIVPIPVGYSLWDLFSERPWTFLDPKVKDAAIFFTAVGVAFFLPSSVAFSLFFFYLLRNGHRMYLGTMTGDPTWHGMNDQHTGGVAAFALAVLWVGRRHWKLVIAQAMRGRRAHEPAGEPLPYPLAFWGLVLCAAVMSLFLWAAGCRMLNAVTLVAMLLLLFFVITRVIAETGLIHGQLQVPTYKPWSLLAANTAAHPVPVRDFYLGTMLQTVWYDFREVVPVYASHGLLVNQRVSPPRRWSGGKLVALLMVSLLVGYVVSFTSTLWTEYHYAWTKDVSAKLPINDWGADRNVRDQMLGTSLAYRNGEFRSVHDPWLHLGIGFATTSVLAFLRLHLPWWPLHPVGYLMVGTFPAAHLWLSIFLGWLCRLLALRFGGAKLYLAAKPAFIGLIVGESLAAGFWLINGIVLSAMDIPYRPVNIMPG